MSDTFEEQEMAVILKRPVIIELYKSRHNSLESGSRLPEEEHELYKGLAMTLGEPALPNVTD